MKLSDLLSTIQPLQIVVSTDIDITDIAIDSRQVKPGTLFIAVPGTQVDGHQFIPKVLEQGAAAVVLSNPECMTKSDVTFILVADSEAVVGHLAHHFFGDPTEKLDLIGVTGTNGKTTIATLLFKMFRIFGYKCGLCSTVCN